MQLVTVILPGELRAPFAPRLSPSPLLPGELSWARLSFSSVEEAEGFALELESQLERALKLRSPSKLRGIAQELQIEAESFLRSLSREPRLCVAAELLVQSVIQLRKKAFELEALANKREALIQELEASLEELEELILGLRFPLLST